MYFLDLFCGIGGSSYGALSAGLKPRLLVDNDPMVKFALAEGLNNFFLQADLSKNSKYIFNNMGDVDVLLCSPPCQNYSRLKYKNKTISPDKTDIAFVQAIIDSIEIKQPKLIIIENVPGFSKTVAVGFLTNFIQKLGYFYSAQTLNAEEFGVPQRRRRFVLIASRKPISIKFCGTKVNIKQAFENLPEINTTDHLHRYNKRHSKLVLERIREIPKNGGSRSSLPERLQLGCHARTNGFKDVYGRMAWERAAPTITGGCTNPSKGRFLHPDENRAITLREAARLQTLPDSLVLGGVSSLEAKAKMIGNAFPSEFVRILIEANL